MVTAFWISWIFFTGDMRATPPSLRMSAGTRSSAITDGGAGVLGDLRLLGVGDVHDDAALEHLGEADVLAIGDPQSVQSVHVLLPCRVSTASDDRHRRALHVRRGAASGRRTRGS